MNVRKVLEEIYWAAIKTVDPYNAVSSQAGYIRNNCARRGFKYILSLSPLARQDASLREKPLVTILLGPSIYLLSGGETTAKAHWQGISGRNTELALGLDPYTALAAGISACAGIQKIKQKHVSFDGNLIKRVDPPLRCGYPTTKAHQTFFGSDPRLG